MRQINQAGLALVKADEGLRLKSYRDVAGIWTIGYGHTPAEEGQSITEAEAEGLLIHDLGSAETAVAAALGPVAATDNQYSAMVSLAFNIGNGAFRGSSVLRMHLAGQPDQAANAFLLWDKAHVDGELVIVPGLLRRRQEERALYLS
jgi:lysozyme